MAILVGSRLITLDPESEIASDLRNVLTSIKPQLGASAGSLLLAFHNQIEGLLDGHRQWDALCDFTLGRLAAIGYPEAVLEHQLTDEQLGLLIRDSLSVNEDGTYTLDKDCALEFLLQISHQEWFKKSVTARLQAVEYLQNRNAILKEALEHHCAGRYISSIPLLLTQLDGILTAHMLATGEAQRETNKKGRVWLVSPDKKKRIWNLDSKLRHSALRDSEHMRGTSESILDVVAPERNAILHGEKTDYGTPERSIKLVLFTDALLRAIICSEPNGPVPREQ